MKRQVEAWRQAQITYELAKLIFYAAFVDGKLDAPRSLLSEVHRCILSRSTRNSSDARCGACLTRLPALTIQLDPVPRFKSHDQAGRISEPVAGLCAVPAKRIGFQDEIAAEVLEDRQLGSD
jgi:hypothetical protein